MHSVSKILGGPTSKNDIPAKNLLEGYHSLTELASAKKALHELVMPDETLADAEEDENYITVEYSPPDVVLCPPMLVESWATEAITKFSKIKIGIMYSKNQGLSMHDEPINKNTMATWQLRRNTTCREDRADSQRHAWRQSNIGRPGGGSFP